jgi:pimeloyl-ACP methyl ester carboxylesterase
MHSSLAASGSPIIDGVCAAIPPVVWISPDTAPQGKSTGEFARRLAPRVNVSLVELAVWGLDACARYDMDVEVAAVQALVDAAAVDRFHLFGFSAGGSVALATALAMPDRVLSVAVLEPASIGDDAWNPAEAAWQAELSRIRTLPADSCMPDFRRLLMRPGLEPPPSRRSSGAWTSQAEKLEDMLERPGFASSDLAAFRGPALIVIGGQSNPRWSLLADHLVDVMPDARVAVFPTLSHFTPPYREQPEAFEQLLLPFWTQASSLPA